MTYGMLSIKIMMTLIICTYTLVFIGNMIWDYKIERMPWSFKLSLGLIAMAMFVSIFNCVLAIIWGIM